MTGTEPQTETSQQAPRGPGLLIGRPFGVPVYVSPSWFLVALIITVTFGGTIPRAVAAPPLSYLVAFVYAVLFYASVFVHELSHALTARLFKLPVRAVTLHILGGETAIEQESPTPGREFLIAAAGPVVNLALAGAGMALQATVSLGPVGNLLLQALSFANLVVGLFNLLPGTPLDGGRLVRAVIWRITGHPRTGTVVVGWLGRGVAVLLLLAGTVLAARYPGGGTNWLIMVVWVAMVSSFMWVGATQTLRDVRVRDRIPLLQARRLARRAAEVTADTPLAEAVRRANQAGAGAIVIVDHEGNPTGLVSERAVLATPEHRRPWVTAGELSRSLEPGLSLPADAAGEDLIMAVHRAPASEYLVLEPDGRIYGVLTAGDVNRAFAGG